MIERMTVRSDSQRSEGPSDVGIKTVNGAESEGDFQFVVLVFLLLLRDGTL